MAALTPEQLVGICSPSGFQLVTAEERSTTALERRALSSVLGIMDILKTLALERLLGCIRGGMVE